MFSQAKRPRSSTSPARRNDVGAGNNVQPLPSTSHSGREDENVDTKLYYRLMEIFPQTCPNYLKSQCKGKTFSDEVLEDLITKLLSSTDYPLRTNTPQSPQQKLDSEEQFKILREVLSDADPTYLRLYCDHLADKPEELKKFIAIALETKNYPTMKDYRRKQQLSAQQRQYTTDFQVEKFLEVLPNPGAHFEHRKAVRLSDPYDVSLAYTCLLNEFPWLPSSTIANALKQVQQFSKAYQKLELVNKRKSTTKLKVKRKRRQLSDICQNIPLLQEVAYVTHKQEIEQYLREREAKLCEEKENEKKQGKLKICMCCFDEEVLNRDGVTCNLGCFFCKQCVEKSVEIAFGEGKLNFLCLSNCSSFFSFQTLQSALNPKLFSKIAQKRQVAEVKAAGIEDLESCPFCDFAAIPAKTDKIFRCLNPDCMKETCRRCKEPSHIPLKCEEVEKDEDVRRRTYIENKMSEALLKKCYQCGKSFVKSDGCNKITCPCGAKQCYLCGEAVTDYSHFNGQGGVDFHKCPLYSDTVTLQEEAVMKGAEAAIAEIGVDLKQLKINPAADVSQHYAELRHNAASVPPGMVALPFGAFPRIRPPNHPCQNPQRQPVGRCRHCRCWRHYDDH